MRIFSIFRSKQNIFSSCVNSFSNKSSYWSNIDNLINKTFNSNDSQSFSPDSLINIAERGLKFQVFDSSFWDQVYQQILKSKDSLNSSQWVQLLHIYKKIKIRNSDLYNTALQHLEKDLNSLSLKELSLLSLSFSYFSFCPNSLFTNIAKIVCDRHEKTKLKELESYVDNQPSLLTSTEETLNKNQNQKTTNKTKSKWNKINDSVSYIHLIGSYAKCGYDHKQLFEVVSEELVDNISNSNVTITPNLIMKTLNSYSRFGYRHTQLLDLLSSHMITSKLSNEDLITARSIFDQLDYHNKTMDVIFSYKLGVPNQTK